MGDLTNVSGDVIDFSVKLDGIEITNAINLDQGPITISDALNDEVDTLDLTLKEADSIDPHSWQEIEVIDNDNPTKPLFGGFVLMPKQSESAANRALNDYDVSASDYAIYLGKVYIQQRFSEVTDKEIIAVLGGLAGLEEYDFESCVVAVRQYPSATFNLRSVKDVISWLAEQGGANWYVDASKCLHYFAQAEADAPFGITQDPLDTDNALCENLEINLDGSGVINEVELIGGNSLSGDRTDQFTPTIISTDLWLNKKYQAQSGESKIGVRRNDGGPTTNLLVNPSFEVNITDGWTQYQAGSGAAWAQDSAKYNQGAKSVKITAGTALSMLRSATITLAPGEPLSAQVMAYTDTLAMASLVIYDATNLVVLAETQNRKTNSWERLTATYVNSGAGSMSVRVELRNNGIDSAQVVYFDAAQAEKLTWPSAYCDGSLGTGYSWSGTANNSTSARVNLAVWRTLTVKTGNSDELEGRDEVLYYESEGRLSQETNWPLLANAVEVDGRIETPVHVTAKNFASYAHYGRWFKEVISDSSIIDPIVARIRCATELAQYAFETTAISFDVRRPGLRSGQTQHLKLPTRGLDGDYLIKRVTTTINSGGHLAAHIELGAVDSGLVGLLIALKNRTEITDSEILSDEILNRVLDFTDDFTIKDSGATVGESQGPYLYGEALYGYSTYGGG